MGASESVLWDPNDWEKHIKLLLRIHYGPGNFVEVPSKHGGDFGIEGFGRDGKAYQCYAAAGPLTTKTLYENQRDKITKDIKKFCGNRAQLAGLFGTTVVCRWILVVPEFTSARLQQHAATKSREVREQDLTYVSQDFEIGVETDDAFAAERAYLANAGANPVQIAMPTIEPGEIDGFALDHASQIDTLDSKLRKLYGAGESVLREHRKAVVRELLIGQNAIEQLRLSYPELHQAVARCKTHQEALLETRTRLMPRPPRELLEETHSTLKGDLAGAAPALDRYAVDHLAWEAIADWMIRCPLRFDIS